MRARRVGGFEALVPTPVQVTARTPAEVLAMATALKRENPARTAAQITRILRAQSGWAPSDHTLQRHFERLTLGTTARPPHGSAFTFVFLLALPTACRVVVIAARRPAAAAGSSRLCE